MPSYETIRRWTGRDIRNKHDLVAHTHEGVRDLTDEERAFLELSPEERQKVLRAKRREDEAEARRIEEQQLAASQSRAPSKATGLRYVDGKLYWDAPAHRGQGDLRYQVVGVVVGDSFMGWGKPVDQWGGVGSDTTKRQKLVGWYAGGKTAEYAVIAMTKYGRSYSEPLRV